MVEHLWIFVTALVAVYLLPGPDVMVILHAAGTQGKKVAVATGVGLGLARMAQVTMAALGLATLLQTAPLAFAAVKIIGAGYLIWLGIGIARSGPSSDTSDNTAEPACAANGMNGARSGYGKAVWRGLLTNITNPKALLFCSVFLPQFVDAQGGNVMLQFASLGIILVAIGFLFDLMYALIGAALGQWMRRSRTVHAIQRWLFSSLLIAFGVRLAFANRPD